ncbi:hypothetical protein LJE06_20445 [Bilophila wadsworthia]|jgi:hypothetical protein|uniref:hypothetical protein n=1 Tax=Bilophila wadsworthia TaxID=35833 RepID=UPI001D0ACECD|nr:hypothetical protein [Bilophila wadsworthia]MCB8573470.1 hypothetical protein [Bilophila wadsworthia]
MTDEEKFYALMAQAEYLQNHAAKLQHDAQEAFSALPLAVEQAGQKIHSTGLQMALILFGLGLIVCGASVGFFVWSTDNLREERNALKVAIQAEEATLAELRLKTWGVRLHEGEKGRFIVLPEGMTSEANWTVGKSAAIRLVK